MREIDFLFSGAAVAVAIGLASTFWRLRAKSEVGWAGAFLFGAVAAFHALKVALALDLRVVWIAALQAIAVCAPFFFWVYARLLFDDGFVWRRRHWVLVAPLQIAAAARLVDGTADAATMSLRILAGLLLAHALWTAVRGARGDLVEQRMRARALLLALGGVLALVVLWRPALSGAAPHLVNGLSRFSPLLAIALMAAAARLHFRLAPESLRRTAPPGRTEPAADPDAADLAKLDKAMGAEEVWREPGLTIGALASRLALPEYRLRRLIHERLGFRNFPAFLTERRLAAAAAALADPAQRASITNVAYDCGFASLGPFNRAFRERFGVTPSAYRRGERAAESSPIP